MPRQQLSFQVLLSIQFIGEPQPPENGTPWVVKPRKGFKEGIRSAEMHSDRECSREQGPSLHEAYVHPHVALLLDN